MYKDCCVSNGWQKVSQKSAYRLRRFEISLKTSRRHCFLFVSLENLISKINARLYCGLLHNIFPPTIYVKFQRPHVWYMSVSLMLNLWDLCSLLSLATRQSALRCGLCHIVVIIASKFMTLHLAYARNGNDIYKNLTTKWYDMSPAIVKLLSIDIEWHRFLKMLGLTWSFNLKCDEERSFAINNRSLNKNRFLSWLCTPWKKTKHYWS